MAAPIRIDGQSDIPVTEQLAAQLVYLIGSGQIAAGEALPSVRALAVRLNLHLNTISEAFQDAILASLVERPAASGCVSEPSIPAAGDRISTPSSMPPWLARGNRATRPWSSTNRLQHLKLYRNGSGVFGAIIPDSRATAEPNLVEQQTRPA